MTFSLILRKVDVINYFNISPSQQGDQ